MLCRDYSSITHTRTVHPSPLLSMQFLDASPFWPATTKASSDNFFRNVDQRTIIAPPRACGIRHVLLLFFPQCGRWPFAGPFSSDVSEWSKSIGGRCRDIRCSVICGEEKVEITPTKRKYSFDYERWACFDLGLKACINDGFISYMIFATTCARIQLSYVNKCTGGTGVIPFTLMLASIGNLK